MINLEALEGKEYFIQYGKFNPYDGCFEIAKRKPLVRCKDCKHRYDSIGGSFCSYGTCVDCVVDSDFFCADGERKEDGDNR